MKCVLYSDDVSLSRRWKNILTKKNPELVFKVESLSDYKNSVIVLNFSNYDDEEDFVVIIKQLVRNNNRVILLDRIPSLEEAQGYLALGIRGYGNVIMSKLYLVSAVDSVINGLVWLAPDITTAFVKNVSEKIVKTQSKDITEEKERKIYSHLTKKEENIARLIKDGTTNLEISETLKISLNTLKKHIKSIYKKLNVKDRISFSLLFS